MSLKTTLFGFFDNTGLAEVFQRKPHDPTSARKPLLRGIENAKRQFLNGQTKAPNRWWRLSNGVVALTVKVKGDTFDINGVATNHMPEERFCEFMDKFKEAVEAGEFDAELANHGNGDAKVMIGKSGTAKSDIIFVGGKRAPINVGVIKAGRGSISPEAAKARGIKAAASRAANKATRETQSAATKIKAK